MNLASSSFTIVGSGSSSYTSSYAITHDGNLWVSGYNGQGQLGIGSTTASKEWKLINTPGLSGHAIKIASNSGHYETTSAGASAYVVTDEGRLFVAGYNSNGQLGTGTTANVNAWTEITLERLAYAVKDVVVPDIAKFTSALLVTKEGNLWVAGSNSNGQIGLGAAASATTWTRVSVEGLSGHVESVVADGYDRSYNAFAITDEGDLWVTGDNTKYNLGIGGNANVKTWTKVTTEGLLGQTKKVAVCSAMGTAPLITYAVTKTGSLFVTGAFPTSNGNSFGFATSSPVTSWTQVPETIINAKISDVTCAVTTQAFATAYVVTNEKDLYVTGANNVGQLGLGTTTGVSEWTKVTTSGLAGSVRSVTAGSNSGTFVITEGGEVFVTGYNVDGQFGLGNKADLTSWTQIPTEGLSGKAVAVRVIPGHSSSYSTGAFILTSERDLFVAGQNAAGEFGFGDTTARTSWTMVQKDGLSGKLKLPSEALFRSPCPLETSCNLLHGISSPFAILVLSFTLFVSFFF